MGLSHDDRLLLLDDHTVVNMNTIRRGRFLTLRTLTNQGGESRDSQPIDLLDLFKKVNRHITPV